MLPGDVAYWQPADSLAILKLLAAAASNSAAEEILRIREEIEQALSRHTGRDIETLRHDTDRDLVLRAEEIVEYGLADQVIDTRAKAAR